MKQNGIVVWVILGTTALLAAMGCWFCWHCPSKIYPPEAHALFWRQLAWNGVGLAVFAAAWLAGWKRLLKAAPWLLAAWGVAIAAAQFSRPVDGAHKWLLVGPCYVNVVTCFMPVFALFVAWLHEKKLIRPWMEWTALAAAALGCVWYIVGNDGRMERLAAFFNPGNRMQHRVYMARQLFTALDVSKWLGDADRSLGFLPCPESDGMISASALLFGKLFPASLVVLFASVGASFTLLWKGAADTARRNTAGYTQRSQPLANQALKSLVCNLRDADHLNAEYFLIGHIHLQKLKRKMPAYIVRRYRTHINNDSINYY